MFMNEVRMKMNFAITDDNPLSRQQQNISVV